MIKTGVSYFGNRILWHVAEDMKMVRENNCNFVVHTFSEEDMEFYKDTMKEIIEISHREGLEVYIDPWAVGGIFGGESYSKFIAEHLDVRQISRSGDSLPAACLNNERFLEFMFKWIDVAYQIGADIFFWDEPHFYIYRTIARDKQDWACRCSVCKKLFKKHFEYNMPSELTKDVGIFKEDSVINFLKKLCKYVKDYRKKNALCLLPFKDWGGVVNWSKAVSIMELDIFGTDPYWRVGEKDVGGYVRRFSKKVYKLCKEYGKEPQIWILNFRIKAGTEGDIRKAVLSAFEEGIRNISAWGFYGAGYMSYLRSDNPKKVWKVLGDVYREIHSGYYKD